MSLYLVDYTSYMRQLAMSHTSIQHSPTETHFFRGELQEFFQRLRSDVCFPCLIAEGCEVEYSGSKDAPIKKRSTSFIIADRYDQQNDYADIQAQMSGCEKIAEEVLGRMLSDKGAPFEKIEFSSIEGAYLQNEVERYVGYRVSFVAVENVCLINKNVWI